MVTNIVHTFVEQKRDKPPLYKINKMKNLLLKSFAVVLFATFITLFIANCYTSIINIF